MGKVLFLQVPNELQERLKVDCRDGSCLDTFEERCYTLFCYGGIAKW